LDHIQGFSELELIGTDTSVSDSRVNTFTLPEASRALIPPQLYQSVRVFY